ncbi:uncharacterized protein BN778_00807 [Mycoplasma sp. CAG:776]|nr:uncharacterized protein BN778_00807 [Mycoplasma sp. CAG:776]
MIVVIMKIKIINYDHIKESEINDRIIRVKAVMMNSKKEILLAEAYTTIQFPGGHLEEGETLDEGLKREVLEETGIILNDEYKPFFALKYFLKDYPVQGNNRSIEIYYYYIYTDEPYNLDNIYLDDQERNGNFKLSYVPLKKLKKYLLKNPGNLEINKIVTNEMLLAIRYLKKSGVLK